MKKAWAVLLVLALLLVLVPVGVLAEEPVLELLDENAAAAALDEDTAETPEESAAAETPEENAAAETPEESAAAETSEENAAAETPEENTAAETPEENTAVETPEENAAAETPEESAAQVEDLPEETPKAEEIDKESILSQLTAVDGVIQEMVPLAYADYNSNDVARMNAIINENFPAGSCPTFEPGDAAPPAEWNGMVEWKEVVIWGVSKPKRISALDISDRGLTGVLDLSGLSNLKTLDCSDNQLTDVTQDKYSVADPWVVDCSNNKISRLDIGGLVGPMELDCSGNMITKIDSQFDFTKKLDCSDNQLESLDLRYAGYMVTVDCSNNQLTELKLMLPNRSKSNWNMQTLDCSNNRLSELDFMWMDGLSSVNLKGNQLRRLVSREGNALTLNLASGEEQAQVSRIDAYDPVSGAVTVVTSPVNGKVFERWKVVPEPTLASGTWESMEVAFYLPWDITATPWSRYDVLQEPQEDYRGEEKGLTITAAGALDDYVMTTVDGNEAEATVEEGSTIVTLALDYLKTLENGRHDVIVHFTDGYAAAEFGVAIPSKPSPSPTAAPTVTPTAKVVNLSANTKGDLARTGDEAESDVVGWILLAALAAIGMVTCVAYLVLRRRRRGEHE